MNKTLTPIPVFSTPSFLTRQQRVWVALYSLSAGENDRSEVLRQNGITEEDIAEFIGSWIRLRHRSVMLGM